MAEAGAVPDDELQQTLAAARAYNENLPDGPLRDPYTLNALGEPVSLEVGRERPFTDPDQLTKGDLFYIDVAGELLAHKRSTRLRARWVRPIAWCHFLRFLVVVDD
ncbi:hypothetical protein AB1K54_04295 [Microbacterium sp. BWT-B31]|uniref:hypothetical protein n=1 Tax=Microbacterium sp. BWT-B31 TaxID=3232072 RepID=UPI003529493E